MKKGYIIGGMMLMFLCSGCVQVEDVGAELESTSLAVSAEVDEQESAQTEPAEVATSVKADIVKERSIARLLQLAKEPLGQTMYVWGGGWNEEDTGAGPEACHIGVSPVWAQFAAKQDATYNFNNTRYQIHNGLDCSGYIGWITYNLMEKEDGKSGYVTKSSDMASDFASRDFGEFTPAKDVHDWKAGDIMSMSGHVWMALGMCQDGSVVLLHSSPPGVILSGTKLSNNATSQAELLANKYMKAYYPNWYNRYPSTARGYSYLTTSSRMRWSTNVLSDEQGLRDMSAEEVLKWLFES